MLKDTRVPLLLNAFSYWGVGFTLAYGRCHYADGGAVGIWMGLTTALWLAAVLLIARFESLTRRLLRAATDCTGEESPRAARPAIPPRDRASRAASRQGRERL